MRVRVFPDPPQAAKALVRQVLTPFALNGGNVADFDSGYTLVDALAQAGGLKIFLTDWRSGTNERRFDTIASLLADLNAVVDDVGVGVPGRLAGERL